MLPCRVVPLEEAGLEVVDPVVYPPAHDVDVAPRQVAAAPAQVLRGVPDRRDT